MIKTYTYKLYNNKGYQRKFDRWVGVCRCVYNLAKETKESAYQNGLILSKFDLMKQLPDLKKEYDWINEVGSQTLQSVIERLDNSFKKFFNGGGYPKWAAKHKYRSFKFKQGVKRTDKGFYLPKFGKVKVFNNDREVRGSIKGATMIRKVDGLYLHIVSDAESHSKVSESQATVGIDVGITKFATLSNGTVFENPRHLDKKLRQLKIEQRSLSRKKKGSNRRHRQRNKVALLHKKVSDCRIDFLHKVSTKIAIDFGKVAVEKLDIQNMSKNKRLSRQMLDCGWGKFFELLEYKTKVVKVNPAYTSQTCPTCYHVAKENRLSQSLFRCTSCGHSENADVVGAKNIEARAFADSRQREVLTCA